MSYVHFSSSRDGFNAITRPEQGRYATVEHAEEARQDYVGQRNSSPT